MTRSGSLSWVARSRCLRPARRLVSGTMVAALLGCAGDDPIVESVGVVALDVSVTDSTGAAVSAATLGVSMSALRNPTVVWDSIVALSDSQGRFQHLIRQFLLDTLVMIRVSVQPPAGSGLTGEKDSVLTRQWVQEPPPDTVRFRFALR